MRVKQTSPNCLVRPIPILLIVVLIFVALIGPAVAEETILAKFGEPVYITKTATPSSVVILYSSPFHAPMMESISSGYYNIYSDSFTGKAYVTINSSTNVWSYDWENDVYSESLGGDNYEIHVNKSGFASAVTITGSATGIYNDPILAQSSSTSDAVAESDLGPFRVTITSPQGTIFETDLIVPGANFPN